MSSSMLLDVINHKKMVTLTPEVIEALWAIAEGYKVSSCNDRYIYVENPKFEDETLNGETEDPQLIIDVFKFLYPDVDYNAK
jgi:hypothetical protein